MFKMKKPYAPDIKIREVKNKSEARICAQIMATSEPWITLQRSYNESLQIVTDPRREIYVAVAKSEIIGFIILQMEGTFTGYIQTVAVKDGWRSRGIGSQLLAFAEKKIFAKKPNVFMCVSSFNFLPSIFPSFDLLEKLFLNLFGRGLCPR